MDGFFGKRNAGDDAFCVVGAAAAHEQWRATSIAFMAQQLPPLPRPAACVLPEHPRVRGQLRTAALTATARIRNVVHVGGSTFRRMNRHRLDQQLLARTGLARLHAAAVSIGPFRTPEDERAIAGFLRYFRTVSVRDQRSLDRLRDLANVVEGRLGFDIATLLPEVSGVQSPARDESRSRRVLGISVCPFESVEYGDSATEQLRHKNLTHVLRTIARRTDVEFRFIALNDSTRQGDAPVLAEYVNQLVDVAPAQLVEYHGDPVAAYTRIAECDALVGMRLHSSVFAYTAQVPFASIAYHPKCQEFAEDAGVAPGRVLDTLVSDTTHAVQVITELLSSTSVAQLPVRVAQQRARAALAIEWGQ